MTTISPRIMQNTISSQASDTVHTLEEAVCRVYKTDSATGFLVTPNCILTCCHVLPKADDAKDVYAIFSEIQGPISVGLNADSSKGGFYHSSKLEHDNGKKYFDAKHLDFALVALNQTMEKVSDIFVLSDQFPPQKKEQIYVIGHPVIEVIERDPATNRNVTIKQLTGEKCTTKGWVTDFDAFVIHHTAPVAGGCSGAPIINEAGHLYAFHQAECPNPAHKKCTNPEHGKKNLKHEGCTITTNCGIGVRADAVFRYLECEKISLDLFKEQRESAALKARYANYSHLELVRPVRGYEGWRLKFPIDDIYAELVILLDDDKERDHAKAPTNPDQGLENYETLFMKKKSLSMDEFFSKLKSFKKILMLGTAGTGKTTFCQKLAFQWSKGSILAEYQSLFWIRLRHLKLDETLDSLFKREFGVILSDKHCSSALLILDGFDELPGYGEDLFHELTTRFQHVIVTSRPKINIPFDIPPIQLEILGIDTANRDKYIEHYFTALNEQCPQKLPKEEVMPKAERLQQLLLTHSLLASLAHIPVNLSLLCAIFSQKETFLTRQEPITATTLYYKIVNWMYSYFRIRQKQLESSDSSLTGDIASQDPFLNDPIVRSVDHALSEIALNYCEKNKLYLSQDDLENFLVNQGASITINQLNDSGLFKVDLGKGGFTHLSYQDFFVARHLVHLYANKERKKAQDFVKAHKLQERYKWIFWMTAGLLSIQYAEILPQYFEDLHQLTPDLGKSYELRLLARCYEECLEPDLLPRYSKFLRDVVSFLKKHPAINLKVELFRDCSRLLHRSEVVQTVCSFPTKSLCDFAIGVMDRKQQIPDQLLEQLFVRIKKAESGKGEDIRLPELLLDQVLNSNQMLSEACLKFICSCSSIIVENEIKAIRILKKMLKYQKLSLNSFEALIEWIEKLNVTQEIRFYLFVKALTDQKKDFATEATFIAESFNRYSFGALLNLNQLNAQEIFNRLVAVMFDPKYCYELKHSSLKLISKMACIDSINSQHLMTDLITVISNSQYDGIVLKALKTLFQKGVSISDDNLRSLINIFEFESKKNLDSNQKKSRKEVQHPYNETMYYLSPILVEFVKNEHALSNHILDIMSQTRCLEYLLLIAKAKKGYAEEASRLILKDIGTWRHVNQIPDFPKDLLEDPFIDHIAQSLLNLLYSQEFPLKRDLAWPLTKLWFAGYSFSLKNIDYFIDLLKKEDDVLSPFLALLGTMIIVRHPNSRDVIEKIWLEFQNFSSKIKIRLANGLAWSALKLPMDIFKYLLDNNLGLSYRQPTKCSFVIKISKRLLSNNILRPLIKQDCTKLSYGTIKNILTIVNKGTPFGQLKELQFKEFQFALSQLKYKDYSSHFWSRKAFIRIAYLTGQPFIETEQS